MSAADSNDVRTCPECGAQLVSIAGKCWLCRQSLTTSDETSTRFVHAQRVGPPRPAAVSDEDSWVVTAMLFVTVVLVLIGVAVQAPGVAIILTLAALPALIRTLAVQRRHQREGRTVETAHPLATFFASFAAILLAMGGIVVTIVIVVVVAVFIACLGAVSVGGYRM